MFGIRSDLFRYTGNSDFFSLIKSFKYPGFTYMFFFRIIQKCTKFNPIYYFLRFIIWILAYRFGFQIPISTKIGKGLLIAHFGTIVVNSKSTIGDNCNIAPNVIIGQANRGKYKGTPQLGDFVWIGTGSVIVGNIQIGNNVLIGPNTFVNRNVPSDSIVVGNPMKIVSKIGSIENYIENAV
jgi:serine O-acetyltransferase